MPSPKRKTSTGMRYSPPATPTAPEITPTRSPKKAAVGSSRTDGIDPKEKFTPPSKSRTRRATTKERIKAIAALSLLSDNRWLRTEPA